MTDALLHYINRVTVPLLLSEKFASAEDWLDDLTRPDSASMTEKELHPFFYDVLKLRASKGEFKKLSDLKKCPSYSQESLDKLASSLANLRVHQNKAELAMDGEKCLRTLLDLIGSAKNYIHLVSFLFFNDEAGQLVADAICAKARAGVKVRVMFSRSSVEAGVSEDNAFKGCKTRHNAKALIDKLLEAGAQFVDVRPLDLRPEVNLSELQQKGIPKAWIDEQIQIDEDHYVDKNHTDHRKLVVVDGKSCAIMSLGIGNEYLNTPEIQEKYPTWHEGLTKITGGSAVVLGEHFAKRWILSGGDIFDFGNEFYSPKAVPTGFDSIRFLGCHPSAYNEKGFCNRLQKLYAHDLLAIAQREFWVENPYVLDKMIFGHWQKILAAHKNKKVHLIRPHQKLNDYPLSQNKYLGKAIEWAFSKQDEELLEAGVSIYEYCKKFSHLKIAVVDDWLATHGSYNLTYRSSQQDLELNVLIESKDYARAVKKFVFERDRVHSRKLKPGDFKERFEDFSIVDVPGIKSLTNIIIETIG